MSDGQPGDIPSTVRLAVRAAAETQVGSSGTQREVPQPDQGFRSSSPSRSAVPVSQASFQKQQREKARRERSAAKEAKRAERGAAPAVEPLAPPTDQAAVLAELADLHERFEAGQIAFDDFEITKQRLVEQLDVR